MFEHEQNAIVQSESNDFRKYINDFFSDAPSYTTFRDRVFDLSKLFQTGNMVCNSDDNYSKANFEFLLEHMSPLFATMGIAKEEELKAKWKDAVVQWSKMGYQEPLPISLLLSNGYMLLDLHPLFDEKITPKNTLSNILRDENHAFWAMDAKYFVSEDKNTLRKIKFIYEVFDINTNVISADKFISIFS